MLSVERCSAIRHDIEPLVVRPPDCEIAPEVIVEISNDRNIAGKAELLRHNRRNAAVKNNAPDSGSSSTRQCQLCRSRRNPQRPGYHLERPMASRREPPARTTQDCVPDGIRWSEHNKVGFSIPIKITHNRDITRKAPLLRRYCSARSGTNVPSSVGRPPHGVISSPVAVVIAGNRNITRFTP